jgi:7-keto-8-aminopelargonate synthetase-like enzyme
MGSATSPRGFGSNPPSLDIEAAAAAFLRQQAALHLPSGFLACRVLTSALRERFDVVLVDAHAHYSVLDAAHTSGRPVHTFLHNDADDLARVLTRVAAEGRRPFVMADGVSPTRGTVPPLQRYLTILRNHPGASLCLDDAHALGVLGEHGRGAYDHLGIDPARVNTLEPADVPLFCGATLSKAVGGYGGIIAGTRAFIERLKTDSPFYSGASQPPVPVAAGTAEALRIIMRCPQLRTDLRRNTLHMRDGLRAAGLTIADGPAPIIWLDLGDAGRMQQIHDRLWDRGMVIAYMPSYAGVGPAGGLRIALCATHTPTMIEQLLDQIRTLL